MGMSTHIKAFIPDTDPEYQKHKKVAQTCIEAGVSLPEETAKYFNCTPNTYWDGIIEQKLETRLKLGEHYTEYRADMCEGFEIDLAKLPEGVTRIRFYNSY
jgi:hypothetical protein